MTRSLSSPIGRCRAAPHVEAGRRFLSAVFLPAALQVSGLPDLAVRLAVMPPVVCGRAGPFGSCKVAARLAAIVERRGQHVARGHAWEWRLVLILGTAQLLAGQMFGGAFNRKRQGKQRTPICQNVYC